MSNRCAEVDKKVKVPFFTGDFVFIRPGQGLPVEPGGDRSVRVVVNEG